MILRSKLEEIFSEYTIDSISMSSFSVLNLLKVFVSK